MGKALTMRERIAKEARMAYQLLRDEGQSTSDARHSAYENTYDLFEDEGVATDEIVAALAGFLSTS